MKAFADSEQRVGQLILRQQPKMRRWRFLTHRRVARNPIVCHRYATSSLHSSQREERGVLLFDDYQVYFSH